jgi:hypothetical protein
MQLQLQLVSATWIKKKKKAESIRRFKAPRVSKQPAHGRGEQNSSLSPNHRSRQQVTELGAEMNQM